MADKTSPTKMLTNSFKLKNQKQNNPGNVVSLFKTKCEGLQTDQEQKADNYQYDECKIIISLLYIPLIRVKKYKINT